MPLHNIHRAAIPVFFCLKKYIKPKYLTNFQLFFLLKPPGDDLVGTDPTLREETDLSIALISPENTQSSISIVHPKFDIRSRSSLRSVLSEYGLPDDEVKKLQQQQDTKKKVWYAVPPSLVTYTLNFQVVFTTLTVHGGNTLLCYDQHLGISRWIT